MEENKIDKVMPEETVSKMENVAGDEENISESQEVVSNVENTTLPDNSEKLKLELEAYQRHFTALEEELKEIRSKYKEFDSVPPDPVELLTGEVNLLKNGFEEIRQMLLNREKQSEVQQQQQQMQNIQQGFFQPPQPQGYAFFPPPVQPMFQSTMIAPAPALPYITTPTPIPTNIQVPQFNFSSNNNGKFN